MEVFTPESEVNIVIKRTPFSRLTEHQIKFMFGECTDDEMRWLHGLSKKELELLSLSLKNQNPLFQCFLFGRLSQVWGNPSLKHQGFLDSRGRHAKMVLELPKPTFPTIVRNPKGEGQNNGTDRA